MDFEGGLVYKDRLTRIFICVMREENFMRAGI